MTIIHKFKIKNYHIFYVTYIKQETKTAEESKETENGTNGWRDHTKTRKV
jgi:hypothetical protein